MTSIQGVAIEQRVEYPSLRHEAVFAGFFLILGGVLTWVFWMARMPPAALPITLAGVGFGVWHLLRIWQQSSHRPGIGRSGQIAGLPREPLLPIHVACTSSLPFEFFERAPEQLALSSKQWTSRCIATFGVQFVYVTTALLFMIHSEGGAGERSPIIRWVLTAVVVIFMGFFAAIFIAIGREFPREFTRVRIALRHRRIRFRLPKEPRIELSFDDLLGIQLTLAGRPRPRVGVKRGDFRGFMWCLECNLVWRDRFGAIQRRTLFMVDGCFGHAVDFANHLAAKLEVPVINHATAVDVELEREARRSRPEVSFPYLNI